jgi:hypothetical protein
MSGSTLIEVVDDFNSILVDLLQQFYKISPNSIVTTNKDKVEKTLTGYTENNDFKKRSKIIEIFVVKILVYKPEIDVAIAKENFDQFLNKSYDAEADGDAFVLNIINEIKKLWPSINTHNKRTIMEYMQILCELAQTYFESVY